MGAESRCPGGAHGRACVPRAMWDMDKNKAQSLRSWGHARARDTRTDEVPAATHSVQEGFRRGGLGASCACTVCRESGDPEPGALCEETLRWKSVKLFPKCEVEHCVQRDSCKGEVGWGQNIHGCRWFTGAIEAYGIRE